MTGTLPMATRKGRHPLGWGMKVLDVVGPSAVTALGKTLPAVLRLSPCWARFVNPHRWTDR